MLYVAQVILYTGILYAIYILLLRNRPMHSFNRAYLLAITILPVVVPFIKLSALTSFFENNRIANVRLPEMVVAQVQQQTVDTGINWFGLTYILVALLMVVLFISRYIKLRSVLKQGIRVEHKDYTLLLDTQYGPGSWGRYILLPDEQVHETIVEHEAAHIRLKHSRDIIFINLLQCIFWPNLFLQVIKNELKQLHEFQADAAVGIDRQQYGELLLSNVFNTCSLPFTHSFNIHPIKRRILMLKKQTKKPLIVTIGFVAMMAAGMLLFNMVALQSCTTKKWEVYKAQEVDKGAEFNGNLYEYLAKNIKYPEEAIQEKLEGRVVVRFTVDEEGNVKDAEVVTENYKGADGKATGTPGHDGLFGSVGLNVIRNMPKWIPAEKGGKKVAVSMTQPITFRLPATNAAAS